MEQKLTAAIAGLYPNAQVKSKWGIGQMVGVDFAANTVWATYGNMESGVNANKCQLILTPLSEISDEHFIEVAKILSGKNFLEHAAKVDRTSSDIKVWTGGYGVATISTTGSVYWRNTETKAHSSPQEILKAYDYLRQNGYDCDSLIHSGLAVKNV